MQRCGRSLSATSTRFNQIMQLRKLLAVLTLFDIAKSRRQIFLKINNNLQSAFTICIYIAEILPVFTLDELFWLYSVLILYKIFLPLLYCPPLLLLLQEKSIQVVETVSRFGAILVVSGAAAASFRRSRRKFLNRFFCFCFFL